jgi:hypothetical protein
VRSPGRPSVARREHRQRFWKAIALRLSSEDVAVVSGVARDMLQGPPVTSMRMHCGCLYLPATWRLDRRNGVSYASSCRHVRSRG